MSWKNSLKRKIKSILKKVGVTESSFLQQGTSDIMTVVEDAVDQVVEEVKAEALQDRIEEGVQQSDLHDVEVGEDTISIPYIVFFPPGDGEKAGYHFFEVIGRQCPKKDDNYITSNMTEAHLARKDIETEYLVVRRTHPAKKYNVWRKDGKIEENTKG